MDLKEIAGQLLSADSLKGIASASGTSSSDVKKVLTQALPALLSGADNQSKTSSSFAKALTDHASADTSDLGSFLKNIDLDDGAKIIGHLLGSSESGTTKEVAKKSGVSESKVTKILSSVAPLLMSLLGKESKSSGIGDLLGSLDWGDLLGDLLDGDSSKKKSSKKSSSGGLGDILGSVLKKVLK